MEFKRPTALFVDSSDDDEAIEMQTDSLITPTPKNSGFLNVIDCKKVTTPTQTAPGAQGLVIIGCPDETKVYKTAGYRALITSVKLPEDVAQWVWKNQCFVHNKVNEVAAIQKSEFKNSYFVKTYLCEMDADKEKLQLVQKRIFNSFDLKDKEKVTELSNSQVTEILTQVLDAILILYEHQLFHNDVAVQNVFCAVEDGDIRIKLFDYGLMTPNYGLNKSYRINKVSEFPWLDYAQFLNGFSQNFSSNKTPPSLEYLNELLLDTVTNSLARRDVQLDESSHILSPTVVMQQLEKFKQ